MPCTAHVKSSSESPFILFHGSQHAIAVCVWIPTASSGFARGFACDDDESYSMLIGMQLPAASCWPATPEGLSCGLLNRVESSWLWIALLLASSEGWTRSARASNCSPRIHRISGLYVTRLALSWCRVVLAGTLDLAKLCPRSLSRKILCIFSIEVRMLLCLI